MNKQDILQLRRQSHGLKPVVMIGAKGLTKAVHDEIECAITAHELIKIRVNTDDENQRENITKSIVEQHEATLINTIGRTIVVYRKKDSAAG